MLGDQSTCPQCFQPAEPGQGYCNHCGKNLLETSSLEATPAAPAASAAAASPRSGRRLPRQTIAGLTIVGLLAVGFLAVAGLKRASQFRVHVTFESGFDLEVGHNVYVEGVRAGTVVSRSIDPSSRQFTATAVVDSEFAPLLQTNSIFFACRDSISKGMPMCIAVYRDHRQRGVPLANGANVTGVSGFLDTMLDVRSKQLKDFLSSAAGRAFEFLIDKLDRILLR